VTVGRTLQPQPGYPFALALTTRWSVGPGGLRADHTATNVGTRSAPFGLGTHPYLTVAGALLDDLALQLPVGRRLLVDERLLPTGDEPVDGTAYDFRTGRTLAGTTLDTAFAVTERDPDGLARSTLVGDDGRGLELWQDDTFGWLQAYTGPGPSGRERAAVAVEPMTCPPDAFRSGTDVVVLEPGERWQGSWGIRPIG
jgi:aldose 1-epimerase